jgi:hypothetical protein
MRVNGDDVRACRNCGETFVVPRGEREPYRARVGRWRPTCCRDCRIAQRQSADDHKFLSTSELDRPTLPRGALGAPRVQ